MIKKLLLLGVLAAIGLIAWLTLSPSRIDPAAWTAPSAPKLEGAYALNSIMKDVQRLGLGIGEGPEGIAVDADGRVFAGYLDGRVIELAADGATYVELANTQGRPLGVALGPKGRLVIADAKKGLVQVGSRPEIKVLSTTANDLRFGFADDVDIAPQGRVAYFTDASAKFPYPNYLKDVIEHRPNGRLLSYDLDTHETRLLLADLYFANGVAVGPDGAYVLVNETSAYRITRYWLKGEKAGTHDVFADNLPGFPDNLSFNGRDRFWVAFPSLRDPQLDAMASSPRVRKFIARLPNRVQGWLQSAKPKHSLVLGFDLDGKPVANLQYEGEDAYAPITSVEEHGPWLYFGSLSEPSIARLPLSRAVAGAEAPPAGWENVLQRPVKVSRSTREVEDED